MDDGLSPKEIVIGVELPNGDSMAYPYCTLRSETVVNDTVGDTDLLVVFDGVSASGVVFAHDQDAWQL